MAEVQKYSEAVKASVERSRREFGKVAMLVVTKTAAVQSDEVMRRTRQSMDDLGPDARVALVLSSQLAKLQSLRTLDSDVCRAFTSESEALAWLTAEQSVGHDAARRSIGA